MKKFCANLRFIASIVAAALLSLVSGCFSLGPDFEEPEWDGPEAWSGDVSVASRLPDGAPWWSVFGDPVLDALEAELLEQNPSLAAAVARLDASAAQLGIVRAGLAPSVDASASAVYDRQSGEAHGSTKFADNPAWLYKPGASFSWELDFWGRVRRNVEAASANVASALDDVRDSRRLLAAKLAFSYISLRTLQARLDYACKNADLQSNTFEIVKARREARLCGDLDMRQAEMNLATTRANIPALEAEIDSTLNSICTLLGRYPGSKDDLREPAPVPLPDDAALPASLPADLLRNRPDVASAMERLHAAVANVGSAKAEFFPKVSLNGSFVFAATDAGRLFKANAQNYSIGPTVEWPIFTAGRLRNQVLEKEASARAAEAEFKEAVLSAAAECETALSLRRHAISALDDLRAAATAAEEAADLAVSLYRTGLTDFENVLDMQRQLASNRDNLAQGIGSAASALVGVWQAFADPDMQSTAESQQPQETNKK
ncbi:MAG: efflux transporter outer membrane subunit [Kiritimatiellae bacterium]|nr:efflux transporter outer membrane subunit [Kiritimatiellia bacterium]